MEMNSPAPVTGISTTLQQPAKSVDKWVWEGDDTD
jgi:hypothetical protein